MIDAWHLKRVHWLRQLPVAAAERLRQAASLREYAPGAMIFSPARHPGSVYLLERGLVRIFRLSDSGARITFGHVTAGEVFGELSVLDDNPRESFAEALKRSTVWRIPKNDFLAALDSHPSIVFEVTKQVGERFKRIESRIEDLVFRDARTRLARMLMTLADQFGEEKPEGVWIELPLTQTDLATLIGATRQTVNGGLRELIDQGCLRREGGRLVISRPAELRRLAEARAAA